MRMDAGLQSRQARFDTSAICSPLGSQSTRHTRAPDAAGLDLTGQGRDMTRDSTLRNRQRQSIARSKPACHICGRPIDYTLHYLDPGAYVIDHVVPLAKGGADDASNLKAAHRSCNSTKRARLVAPIVRRSGSLG